MKAEEEITLALDRARTLIRDGRIGEDRHGEIWIMIPEEDGWARLYWLIQQERDTEGSHPATWLDIALTALYEAEEEEDGPDTVETPIGPLTLLRLKS
jgi:hypothetical protein